VTPVVFAQELGRWYGQVVGLNEVSLTLDGGVTGLVGPNGAGKSTLLKLIVGEIRPSRGSVRVLGERPFANRRFFRRLGFCPQQDALYDDLSGYAFVRFLLRLSGFAAREASAAATAALERVGLAQAMHRRVGEYSKGMRQRVKIAQAIAHAPELLVCDEPLSGLDPVGRREIIELLRGLAAAGTNILISSHVLHEVTALTENIVLLHRGRVLAQGSVPDIRKLLTRYPRRVELVAAAPRRLATELISLDNVRSVQVRGDEPAGGTVVVETHDIDRFQREMTRLAAATPFGIRRMESVDAGLEAVFDYLVG